MKTILTALREKNKVTDAKARTIGRALGGQTIGSAISSASAQSGTQTTPKTED